jgi:hypothetical protein
MCLPNAEASTTEEPDAGKPHAGTVRGALGNRRSYRERGTADKAADFMG